MKVLGIDIGGTGIKGAVVDTKKGHLVTDRIRLLTPEPATPDAVGMTVTEIAKHFEWTGPIGCTFPGVVRGGTVFTAANVDKSWINADASRIISDATGCPVTMVNDADAAGEAETRFGAARGKSGVILTITLGTGIGSALMIDGTLVPNTELGHLWLRGGDAESGQQRQFANVWNSTGPSGQLELTSICARSRNSSGLICSSSVAAYRRRRTSSSRT